MAIQLPVFIEPMTNGMGFRARMNTPFEIFGEGVTEAEAVRCLESAMREHLQRQGMKLTALTVPVSKSPTENPLAARAGDMKDDPLFDTWQDAMREYRQQRDREEATIE